MEEKYPKLLDRRMSRAELAQALRDLSEDDIQRIVEVLITEILVRVKTYDLEPLDDKNSSLLSFPSDKVLLDDNRSKFAEAMADHPWILVRLMLQDTRFSNFLTWQMSFGPELIPIIRDGQLHEIILNEQRVLGALLSLTELTMTDAASVISLEDFAKRVELQVALLLFLNIAVLAGVMRAIYEFSLGEESYVLPSLLSAIFAEAVAWAAVALPNRMPRNDQPVIEEHSS